ncbi:MAG TPA: substrate-binding domain-containing protein [Tepidisphaeraceae bacterium]|jgi:ribose transport system substrate-binding protein
MPRVFLAVCVALALVAGCKESTSTNQNASSNSQSSSNAKPQIAVIPKGTTHEFWKSVQAGAQKAGQEFNADIIWKGPVKEDDRASQIQVVQEFVADKVAGIVLAPLDENALANPVRAAAQENIPVVIIDSALKGTPGKDFVSFVATDNHKGGELGGEQLAKLLDNKGKVVLLRYAVGSASTEARETGFLDAIKKHPDIQVISSDRYAGATVDTAKTSALNMVDTLKQADGVFCPNESATIGMLLALQQLGLAGKVKFVGFDQTQPLIKAMKDGQVNALVAQDPFKIGYMGVKTMMQHIKGEKVDPLIDTGVQVITPENVNTPEIQNLLAH